MNYQLVVIDRPIENWNNPVVKELFPKIIDLKKRCFHSFFEKSYVIADTFDFLGTHVVICQKTQQGLEPLLTFKVVTDEAASFYHQSSPILDCSSDSTFHQSILEKWLTSKMGASSYVSSFAVDPTLGPKTKYELIKMSFEASSLINSSWGIRQSVCVASTQTKANSLYRKAGYKALLDDSGNELSCFFVPSFNVEAELMVIDNETQEEIAKVNKDKSYWTNRIEISSKVEQESYQIAS